MCKSLLIIILLGSLPFNHAFTQVSIGIGVGPGFDYGRGPGHYRRLPQQRRQQVNRQQPKFDPIIHFSLGYGYPNLDQYQMASFYNFSRGNATQSGPITGSIDYQYSKTSSIGIMVTHGQVTAPYYDYSNSSNSPSITGSLNNWSVMLNLVNYLPTGGSISPYFRTALGINIWKQDYQDAGGNKLGYVTEPGQFAYQIGLGAKFNITRNTSFFVEGGYGKYILNGGLSFKL